ncbi:MAG TPA: hypothetical protein VEU28_01180 [Actinomycetota bacterium]|nr:hypothetical protein [Actinomycetota bacterium]
MIDSQHGRTGRSTVLRSAVILSIAAGLIHGLNVQEHLAEWWGYGFFFLFAAAAQFLYGLILIVQPWNYDETGGRRDGARYARHFYRAGIATNVFLIGLYLVTRTVGIPFLGPAAGETEPFTGLGVVTKLIEAGLVAVLLTLVRQEDRPSASPAV